MSILERMNKAIEEIDTATMEELVHDDFQFYFHSSGANIGKSEIIEWVKSGDVKNESPLTLSGRSTPLHGSPRRLPLDFF